ARHRGGPARAPLAGDAARGQGRGRGRGDPGAGRGGERGGGRARPSGRGGAVAADHAGAGVAVAALGNCRDSVIVDARVSPGARTRKPVSGRPAAARLNASVTWLTGSAQKKRRPRGAKITR